MSKECYYIARQVEEDCSYGVVHLTEQEFAAVRKFLNQVDDFTEGYCGSCEISDKIFETEKEAVNYMVKITRNFDDGKF